MKLRRRRLRPFWWWRNYSMVHKSSIVPNRTRSCCGRRVNSKFPRRHVAESVSAWLEQEMHSRDCLGDHNQEVRFVVIQIICASQVWTWLSIKQNVGTTKMCHFLGAEPNFSPSGNKLSNIVSVGNVELREGCPIQTNCYGQLLTHQVLCRNFVMKKGDRELFTKLKLPPMPFGGQIHKPLRE